jgi:hypothetical protein
MTKAATAKAAFAESPRRPRAAATVLADDERANQRR